MKKLLCLLGAAALMLSFAACGKNETPASPVETATTVKNEYIAAEVGENLNKTELFKTEKDTYYMTVMQGKQVFCRTDQQGRLKILLTFGENQPHFFDETFARSGKKMIYYTYQNKDEDAANLYAFNLSTERAVKLIGAPCSEFILLNMPESFEMYSYGFIAAADGMKVIDLKSGGISKKYSMTVSEMKVFFVDPDSHPDVLFGRNLTTTITDAGDRAHIRLDTVESKSNGEIKRKWSVSFAPALSVVQELQ